MDIKEFAYYIGLLGFETLDMNGRYYWDENVHIEVEARYDNRPQYEGTYYRVTFWGGSRPLFNHDLRAVSDANEVISIVNQLMNYYNSSPRMMDRYDSLRDILIKTLLRQTKINTVLGVLDEDSGEMN